MGDKNKSNQIQVQTPKRSFFSYICPCFNFTSNHKLNQKSQPSMSHLESNSKTEINQDKRKESTFETLGDLAQDVNKKTETQGQVNPQSGIYIQFKQDQPENQQKSQYALMQEDYERYLKQNRQPKAKLYPIQSFKENKMFVLGNKSQKMLCKIKSIYIQPSESSKQLQKASRKSQQKCSDPIIQRYWDKRYFLFQKFDEGIKLDQQSWFSVTPQAVAQYIASKLSGFSQVLDGFCGAGGDSLKMALNCKKVVSNDIDQCKLQLLLNNATVYGVDNIQATNCDFFDLDFKRNELDAVYLSPPWGGPEYYKLQRMLPEDFLPPLAKVIKKSISLSDNVIFLLPVNTDLQSLPSLIYHAYLDNHLQSQSCSILLQKVYFQGQFKFLVLSIGNRVNKINLGDQLEHIYMLLGQGDRIFKYKRVIKKIRQEIGMLRLFNSIFQCQKKPLKPLKSTYDALIDYLADKKLISKQKMSKLQEMDENDANQLNQSKKEKKMNKKLFKSMRVSNKADVTDLRATYNQVNPKEINSPLKKGKIEQTVSYISEMSQSKILQSPNINQNEIMKGEDLDGVKIELVKSELFQKE